MDDLIANLIVRILWAALFGWWISIIWYLFAIAFVALVFSAPLGYWMLERIEMVFSFNRESHHTWRTRKRIVLGVIWFYLIGWWAGLFLISLASVCVLTVLAFPAGSYLMRFLDTVVILS